MSKITIIGTGKVGSTIAYTLAVTNVATEIIMIDIDGERAIGEALDIRQGTPFCSPCFIRAGSYLDASGSDIVVITSGVARKPGQSRLDLTQTNVNIMKDIIPQIVSYCPNAKYVIVSNPVDIMTYVFCKYSGVPENHVIGSGTILDTSRLRARLSEFYHVNQHNVHAYVMGEHGDSSFIPWSLANISNVPIGEYKLTIGHMGECFPEIDKKEIENYVRTSGARVIQRKGATFYAVSVSVCHICKCLLGSVDTTMTVSTMMHGEYGIEGVCLSILTAVNQNGVHGKVMTPLTHDELQMLQKSAKNLKEVIESCNI